MLTSKLVNPTPFKVKIPWDKGIILDISPDSEIDLTMAQMDDFRPGKPGSEEARHILDYHGLFLLDGDRSWDEQAAKAVETSLKEKRAQFEGFVTRIRDARIANGAPVDDASLKQLVDGHGYGKLEKECEVLERRLSALREILAESGPRGKVKETLDPKRTCFITQPPREFPSETALKLFLMEQDPEFVARHEEYQKQLIGDS